MSYSSNPLLPKARADAVRLLVLERLPVAVAARKSGVHRVTLWRWKQQWLEINQNVQLENSNRPNRKPGSKFRLAACTWRIPAACTWRIPTKSSRPYTCKHAVTDAVVDCICYYRSKFGRCAVIVHAYCKREGTLVSLATVRRVLNRLGLIAKRKWKRGYRPPVTRPLADAPGDLVQTDTVHLYDHATRSRTYLYTLVDVYSRWSYSEHHTVLSNKDKPRGIFISWRAMMAVLFVGVMVVSLSAAGCGDSTPSTADQKDLNTAASQQDIYSKVLPVPIFDYSVERDVLIQISIRHS